VVLLIINRVHQIYNFEGLYHYNEGVITNEVGSWQFLVNFFPKHSPFKQRVSWFLQKGLINNKHTTIKCGLRYAGELPLSESIKSKRKICNNWEGKKEKGQNWELKNRKIWRFYTKCHFWCCYGCLNRSKIGVWLQYIIVYNVNHFSKSFWGICSGKIVNAQNMVKKTYFCVIL